MEKFAELLSTIAEKLNSIQTHISFAEIKEKMGQIL